jgi:chromosome segregation ATPase
MLVAPRPDFLATAEERVMREQIAALEQTVRKSGGAQAAQARIERLKGVLHWRIHTGYDQRLTDAYKNLRALDAVIAALKEQYDAYVRTRQAATQSYEGYERSLTRLRGRVREAQERVQTLMARQGHMLEVMAVNELELRTQRLEEYQIKARFALADSYDRAVKAQTEGGAAP